MSLPLFVAVLYAATRRAALENPQACIIHCKHVNVYTCIPRKHVYTFFSWRNGPLRGCAEGSVRYNSYKFYFIRRKAPSEAFDKGSFVISIIFFTLFAEMALRGPVMRIWFIISIIFFTLFTEMASKRPVMRIVKYKIEALCALL